jgi:hypothetical protein
MRSPFLWFPIFISLGCSDGELGLFDTADFQMGTNIGSSQEIRIDISPSDASASLLPQSFVLEPEDSWTELSLELKPNTAVTGYIHGFSIYPYMDTTLPGEDVPVEAQVQVIKDSAINGGIINSDEYGYFSLAIPEGIDYQISVTPLSPQNVPYTIVENLNLEGELPQLDIDLGVGLPIYGLIEGFAASGLSAQAQLIDADTGIKGPQIEISDNGYFQLRAPTNRRDFIVRIKGEQNDVFPTIDIPIRTEENDEDGFRLDLSIGDLSPSTVSGTINDINGSGYFERATIRFRSISLTDSDGFIELETNNDSNGNFTVNLLEGSYDMEIIPPYDENALEAPVFLTIEVNENQEELGVIHFKEKINYSAVILGVDGLPSTNVTVNLKEQGFNEHLYSGKTDDSGRLNILIPPADMNVSLIPDNSIEAITNFSISADDVNTTEEPEWHLQEGRTLSGTISTADDFVRFALIEVYQGNTLLANGLSDMEGAFSLQLQTEE